MKTVSIAQAKDTLTALVREAEEGRPVAISRRGRPVVVLLGEAEYTRLRAAAAAADFGSWLQAWRLRLPADFEGISAEELARWG
ncbi:prevent-host-death family protein [Fontimonas thermophila]|uniref:Antitoxin n=1 Tax=Fontimonas thermophila TaxID=1076937 RepID=A0A1I2H4Y2_9GAMM|nr:type II toxin-antitoxin system Phd/YefM family antitoxin [Fontimonas thermophila]SFF23731.1 prevent-host-death family protein [Fontimonas thermophila]